MEQIGIDYYESGLIKNMCRLRIAAGFNFGIDKKDTFNFVAIGQGVRSAYTNMSRSFTSYRKGDSVNNA